jgi:hypothetical protein
MPLEPRLREGGGDAMKRESGDLPDNRNGGATPPL